jgi:PD-(D/E)XK nuclease superfamily
MAFEPDIIVTGPEPAEIALVAEVKTSSRSIDDSERQLKNYMAAVSAPVGLLIAPETCKSIATSIFLLTTRS